MQFTRNDAIESGVHNAVDTVVTDKAMTAEKAYAILNDFVSDGLSAYQFSDRPTHADMEYARSCWPL